MKENINPKDVRINQRICDAQEHLLQGATCSVNRAAEKGKVKLFE